MRKIREAPQQEEQSTLARYGCSTVEFSGSHDGLYDRHLLFDYVMDQQSTGRRERFEAFARAVRDVLVPAATALPAVQHRAARRLSQVSVSYPASPLVQADGGRREPKPGHRFPDVEVRTEKGAARLYRVLGGGRHVLVMSSAQARAARGSTGPGPDPLLVDVVEGCAGARDGFALVRPDGVLAARGSGKDVHRVTTYLHQLSGAGPVRTQSAVLPEGTS